MIVECENCGSNFDVDDIMLMPSGRKLKCSSCKMVFFQKPPSKEDIAATAEPSDGQPPAAKEKQPEEEPPEDEEESEETQFIENIDDIEKLEEPDEVEEVAEVEELEELEELEEFEDLDELDELDELEDLDELDDDEAETILAVPPPADDTPEPLMELEEEEVTSFDEEEEEEVDSLLEEEEEEEEITSFDEEEEIEEEDDDEPTAVQLDSAEEYEDDDEEYEDLDEHPKGSPFFARLKKYKKALTAAAAILLVTLAGGWVAFTDWWDYQAYSMSSDFHLEQLDGEWRLYEFGSVLMIKGSISNATKVTKNVPKVIVSLFDDANNQLSSVSIVPGRVVADKILDVSGEEALRSMTTLQEDIKKIKVEKLWPNKEMAFQALFIQPPEAATRYQVDFETAELASKGSTGARTFTGNF